MPASSHSILSCSSAERYIQCPRSVRLSEHFENKSSPFSEEGSVAHEMAERKLLKALGVTDKYEPVVSEWVNKEMEEHTNSYVSYIMEIVKSIKDEGKDFIALVEQKVDLSDYAPECYGTADSIIASPGKLYVNDFKYGSGVLVKSEMNAQMMLYSLGALTLLDNLFDIEEIEMTIYQPRLGNVSSYLMKKEDLLKWANDVFVPQAKLAYEGKGEFKVGSHCRWCLCKQVCKARAEHNLELAKMEFKEPSLLTHQEIGEVLDKADALSAWAEDVKSYAFKEALSGHNIPGYKLVEGRSTRKISDEIKVGSLLVNEGFDPYEKKLMGITTLTKLIGKNKFVELVEPYIIKPAGKPTLVKEDDPRPELNNAINDFKDEM